MKILIIDNYDSFTFNLYQYVGEILQLKVKKEKLIDEYSIIVKRNDEITIEEIKNENFDRIIISPGPGDPSDKAYFGVCADVLIEVGKTVPVLGVCLGMQGMAHYFGGKVVRASYPMHGKTSSIMHDGKGVFYSLPQEIEVMRYHSLIVERESVPKCFEVTAYVSVDKSDSSDHNIFKEYGESPHTIQLFHNSQEIEIMGLRHKEYPIEGIQFHPESFATEGGKIMLENFLF